MDEADVAFGIAAVGVVSDMAFARRLVPLDIVETDEVVAGAELVRLVGTWGFAILVAAVVRLRLMLGLLDCRVLAVVVSPGVVGEATKGTPPKEDPDSALTSIKG